VPFHRRQQVRRDLAAQAFRTTAHRARHVHDRLSRRDRLLDGGGLDGIADPLTE